MVFVMVIVDGHGEGMRGGSDSVQVINPIDSEVVLKEYPKIEAAIAITIIGGGMLHITITITTVTSIISITMIIAIAILIVITWPPSSRSPSPSSLPSSSPSPLALPAILLCYNTRPSSGPVGIEIAAELALKFPYKVINIVVASNEFLHRYVELMMVMMLLLLSMMR